MRSSNPRINVRIVDICASVALTICSLTDVGAALGVDGLSVAEESIEDVEVSADRDMFVLSAWGRKNEDVSPSRSEGDESVLRCEIVELVGIFMHD